MSPRRSRRRFPHPLSFPPFLRSVRPLPSLFPFPPSRTKTASGRRPLPAPCKTNSFFSLLKTIGLFLPFFFFPPGRYGPHWSGVGSFPPPFFLDGGRDQPPSPFPSSRKDRPRRGVSFLFPPFARADPPPPPFRLSRDVGGVPGMVEGVLSLPPLPPPPPHPPATASPFFFFFFMDDGEIPKRGSDNAPLTSSSHHQAPPSFSFFFFPPPANICGVISG